MFWHLRIRKEDGILEGACPIVEFLKPPPVEAAAAAVVRAAVRMQGKIRMAEKERAAAPAASPAQNL